MSEKLKSISSANTLKLLPYFKRLKIALIVSEYNSEITEKLFSAAFDVLVKSGFIKKNIIRLNVPGSFELCLGASMVLNKQKVHGVICLGCIIKGETQHDLIISQAVAQGIMNLNLTYKKPVIFGVLTTKNYLQALERSGDKKGNKGEEAALALIKMLLFRKDNI